MLSADSGAFLIGGYEQVQGENLVTVGIDIGTSTTKLVFSRLHIVNTTGHTRLPRFEILERSVVYRSPIFRTPLISNEVIDVAAISLLIQNEYKAAGFTLKDVKTGAVIITGETATKRNAHEVLMTLAERSGDFVVATAGPVLEGILAGKGSGAWELSKKTGETVANIDVGGGTANIAVFRRGEVVGTCTLHIGGRMLCFENGFISRISPSFSEWLKNLKIPLSEGMNALEHEAAIHTAVDKLAEVLMRALDLRMPPEDNILLLGRPPNWMREPNYVVFSGGVAEVIPLAHELTNKFGVDSFHHCLQERAFANDGFADCGLMLAHAAIHCRSRSYQRIDAIETERATVIGVGTQSMEISGSTIYADAVSLPVKNCPVVVCRLDNAADLAPQLREVFVSASDLYDLDSECRIAFALRGISNWSFHQLQHLARAFNSVMTERGMSRMLLTIVVDGDVGKALGQCLIAANVKNVVCIDQIHVDYGDYIDIGVPLNHGESVPVVIKTLVLGSPGGVVTR